MQTALIPQSVLFVDSCAASIVANGVMYCYDDNYVASAILQSLARRRWNNAVRRLNIPISVIYTCVVLHLELSCVNTALELQLLDTICSTYERFRLISALHSDSVSKDIRNSIAGISRFNISNLNTHRYRHLKHLPMDARSSYVKKVCKTYLIGYVKMQNDALTTTEKYLQYPFNNITCERACRANKQNKGSIKGHSVLCIFVWSNRW